MRTGVMVIFALTALIALVLLLVAPSAHGAADSASGDYMTSGVGADEVERVKAYEKDFNLKLVFTLVEGNYVSDEYVRWPSNPETDFPGPKATERE